MGCLASERYGRYLITILFDMFFTVGVRVHTQPTSWMPAELVEPFIASVASSFVVSGDPL